MVINTFSWQRFGVVQLDVEGGGRREEASKPKRARLEENIQTQILHNGSEIGLYLSLILCFTYLSLSCMYTALVCVDPMSFQMLTNSEVSVQHPVTIQQVIVKSKKNATLP